MKKRLLPFVLAGALTAGFAAPAAAQVDPCQIEQTTGRGGNAALAALIAAVVDVEANVGICEVNVLNNSLNNLLRKANIEVLNNSLNNLLRDSNIEIVSIERSLNNNVVTVDVLSGPDIILNP